MSSLAVIILAAGKGTRMKSAKTKVLHEICGRPMVLFPIDLATRLRANKTVVVVGHQAEQVKQAIRTLRPRVRVDFALQSEQNGTGHAVLQAKKALRGFRGEVLILSGDVPLLQLDTLRALQRQHLSKKADLTVMTTFMDDPTGYGRCVVGEGGRLERIVEHKDATAAERRIEEINAGIYCIDSQLLWRSLAKIGTDNAQGEMYLTDIVHVAGAAKKSVYTFAAEDAEEVSGVNSRADLARIAELVRGFINDEHMRAGVTMLDPYNAYIDFGVKIGPDTVLEPGVMLTGKTRVGAGCRIGLGARLHDAIVADDAEVPAHADLKKSRK
ncbi:MAG: sugar phosphate nucleotidyltransferase [Candidatus Lernaella stagnicola]|nr:sugar phosphate nucleotidyltransferase [Candidatus Lernaella stagnicola]